jgi:large subunit ribosomal protein L9
MEVILLERIDKLGLMGDVVNVKPGYARNFLLPRKKALRATKENIASFDTDKKQLEANNLEHRKEAEKVAEKLDGMSAVIIRSAGETGQLYGSVNARNISDAITQGGVTIGRNQVTMDRPIKSVGLHETIIALHPEVSVTVNVNVARTEEEAARQAKTGKAVTAAGEEDTDAEAEAAAEVAAMAAEAFLEQPSEPEEEAGESAAAGESEPESAPESGAGQPDAESEETSGDAGKKS